MNKVEYKNIVAFHPGYYLKEFMDTKKIKHEVFAKLLNMSKETLDCLIKGEIDITPQIATNLSLVCQTSYEIWISIQRSYNRMISEIEILRKSEGE